MNYEKPIISENAAANTALIMDCIHKTAPRDLAARGVLLNALRYANGERPRETSRGASAILYLQIDGRIRKTCNCAVCKRGIALICPRSLPAGDSYGQSLLDYVDRYEKEPTNV